MTENHLARFRVKDYRGIEFVDTAAVFPNGIPAKGMIIKGENAAGKTSALNAIMAGLAGQDIKEDAIRHDADRYEIMIDLTHASVERALSRGSRPRLVVKDESGKPIKSPAEWLRSILGSTLDPLAFMRKKPDEQKAYVLSAIPVAVTPAQVKEWTEGWTLNIEPDYSLHGLEVVLSIRQDFFERRGAKNAAVKELQKEQEALEAGAPPAPPVAPSIEEADAKSREASNALGEMKARAARVAEVEKKTEATRNRVAALRTEADEIVARPPADDSAKLKADRELPDARESLRRCDDRIAELQAEIDRLRDERECVAAAIVGYEKDRTDFATVQANVDSEHKRAAQLRAQADDLESAIAATSEAAPSEGDIFAAELAIKEAETLQAHARAAQLRREHETKIAAVAEKRAAAEVEASNLDAMVKKFTKVIPGQLMAASNGVEGITIDGDEVELGGVRISKLAGRERYSFAIQLAKRLNKSAKILIVDGLEAVDDESLPHFIEEATSDGFQLIATRVEPGGGVHFEAIGGAP